jgi:flagellar hook-basal body complex protein FliE
MSVSPFAPITPGNTFKTDLSAVNNSKPAFSLNDDNKKGESFPNLFMSFLKNANDSQNAAGEYTKKLVTGQLTNTHEMAIAGAKSEVMLHLVTQITSKLSSMTTTLFQMQI